MSPLCTTPRKVKPTTRRGVPYIPVCGAVSEISVAQEAGCVICKIFPAGNVGGPSFVKNIKAPLPWAMIMATGAVEPTEENLKKWFEAGVVCVVMGSKLFPKESIQEKKWDEISRLCANTLAIISSNFTK